MVYFFVIFTFRSGQKILTESGIAKTYFKALMRYMVQQSNPITGLDRPWGFQQAEAPTFQDNWHIKVVRLSAPTYRPPLPSRKYSWYSFLLEAGRIMSMKSSNDTIGNRTRDLPGCSAVPQPTAPLRAPPHISLVPVLTPLYLYVSTFPKYVCSAQYGYFL
jgi:hypothetical protein